MAVFSEILTDTEILNIVKAHNAHKIFIAGCSGCTNESLAYSNSVPVFKSPDGQLLNDAFNQGVEIPFAVHNEALRLKQILEKHGYLTEFAISHSNEIFCIRHDGDVTSFEKSFDIFKPDIILSISCPAGVCGLQDEPFVKNNKIPIIRLMRPLGQMAYSYTDTETERIMIYDSVKICKNK